MKAVTFIYFPLFAFISIWWWMAFLPSGSDTNSLSYSLVVQREPTLHIGNIELPPLQRETLYEALSGNTDLMTRLMAEWDIEAQLLLDEGLSNVQRLSHEQFISGQRIGRTLSKGEIPKSTKQRFYPQTFMAASFLLALVEPEQIVAIPAGLRRQTQLYSRKLTDRIPADIDCYHAEQLFLNKPHVAFVANYSLPTTLQMLKSQGISLCKQEKLESLTDLLASLREVGKVIEQPEKAEIMALFITASLYAIDNRLLACQEQFQANLSTKTVYLNNNLYYAAPTQRMIIGQLLKRLHINECLNPLFSENDHRWKVPVENEQLSYIQPDCFIISSTMCEYDLKMKISCDPSLSQLESVKNQRVFLVDEEVQETPSQYIVLAYYDLYLALTHAITS